MKYNEEYVENLIQEIKKLKEENKKLKSRKKYGIVWEKEKEPEKVVLECQQKIPILKDVKDKEILTDKEKPMNLIIEGDNYHALQVLNYTHKGKIDIIYIDPPYNTGKTNEWKYNDKYVDKEDSYKHSKWLNFMGKRLTLARELLKNTGLIFISIDYHEMAQLKMLADQIFQEDNFLAIQIWRGMHTVRNSAKAFNLDTEYIITYAKNINCLIDKGNKKTYLRLKKDKTTDYPYNDNDDKGRYKLDPIYSRNYYKPYQITFPNGVIWEAPRGNYPRYSKQKLLEMYNNNEIVFSGKEPKAKRYLKNVSEGVPPNTLLPTERVGFNKEGTKELYEIFGQKVFDQPKPTTLIEYLLDISNSKINSRELTVLDFMAGSGSTGHAVLKKNMEDGGNRKFILCTNNENNICTDVCYPRLKKVIEGYSYEGTEKKIVWEKKIGINELKNGDKIYNELKNIKEEYKKHYPSCEITESMSDKEGYLRLIIKKKVTKTVKKLEGNLKYFKTDFIDVGNIYNISDEHKIELTYKAGEMIAIKEDVFEEVDKNKWWQIFKNTEKTVAIYFREDQSKLFELFEKLKDNKAIIYLFSWGKNELKASEYGYNNIKIKDIPQPIIDVYKEINRL